MRIVQLYCIADTIEPKLYSATFTIGDEGAINVIDKLRQRSLSHYRPIFYIVSIKRSVDSIGSGTYPLHRARVMDATLQMKIPVLRMPQVLDESTATSGVGPRRRGTFRRQHFGVCRQPRRT